jgi:hypothetical protein
VAELALPAREALKPLLKALAYVVFALYLALGTIAVAIFAVRRGLPVIVIIAAPFLLILIALLALLALYAIIELCVRLAARRAQRAHYLRPLHRAQTRECVKARDALSLITGATKLAEWLSSVRG